jgi:hypothetical protein
MHNSADDADANFPSLSTPKKTEARLLLAPAYFE